jgi:hypothetical protein
MSSRSTHLRIAALMGALTVLLVACGDDDSSADAGPYIDATAVALTTDEGNEDFELSESEAECLAEGLVATVGVEELEAAGISPEEFAAAENMAALDVEVPADAEERVAEAVQECTDIRAVMSAAIAAELGDEATCVVETVDESELAAAMAKGFVSEDAEAAGVEYGENLMATAPPPCAEAVLLSTGVGQGDITEADAECIAGVLDDQVAANVIAASAAGEVPSAEDNAAIQTAFAACGLVP